MIKLDDKYSVGISIIDEEHKELIGILNKAIFAKEHNDSPEEIKEVLREMTNYTLIHIIKTTKKNTWIFTLKQMIISTN